jgi:hypothetical protein
MIGGCQILRCAQAKPPLEPGIPAPRVAVDTLRIAWTIFQKERDALGDLVLKEPDILTGGDAWNAEKELRQVNFRVDFYGEPE